MNRAVKEHILLGEVDFFYNGDNLLELAARSLPRSEAKEIGCLLLDGGSDVNGESSDGFTPLQTACCRGLVGLSELLLQRGANRFRASPTGEDALDCALGFLAACDLFGSQARQEDVDLAKLCCRLRNSRIERARSSGKLPSALAKARLCLSQVATQLALLGGKFVKLSQEEVFEMSGLSKASVQSFGKQLWAGWPGAFLTFDTLISNVPDIQESFAHARSRVLSSRLSQNEKNIFYPSSNHRRFCYHCDDYDDVCWRDYDYVDWEFLERGDAILSPADYSQRKMQSPGLIQSKKNQYVMIIIVIKYYQFIILPRMEVVIIVIAMLVNPTSHHTKHNMNHNANLDSKQAHASAKRIHDEIQGTASGRLRRQGSL